MLIGDELFGLVFEFEFGVVVDDVVEAGHQFGGLCALVEAGEHHELQFGLVAQERLQEVLEHFRAHGR